MNRAKRAPNNEHQKPSTASSRNKILVDNNRLRRENSGTVQQVITGCYLSNQFYLPELSACTTGAYIISTTAARNIGTIKIYFEIGYEAKC